MNLPSGNIVKQGLALKETDFKKLLQGLINERFSGYAALTIEGFDGFEEGTMLFKKGFGVACIFEYLKFDITIISDLALQHFFNAAGADFGVIDVIQLSDLQVDMSIAFDEKIRLSKPFDSKELDKHSISKFDASLAKKTLEEAVSLKSTEEVSKKELFKRFGLGEMGTR
jgi:hypothetical protein